MSYSAHLSEIRTRYINKTALFSFKKGDRYLFFFLLALPLINAAADSTIYYFVEADREGGLHPGIIRGGILIFFIFLFGFRRISRDLPNRFILVFLVYLFILTLFSSEVRSSFLSGYIKWFIPLMMYPVGLYFFRNNERLLTLNNIYIYSALLVCINLVAAQITGYGISAYVEKSFYTGGAGVGITNQLALILLTYPFLFRRRFKIPVYQRWFIYLIGFLSVVFIFLAMKRAAIVSLLAGALIYLYFTQSRIRFIRYFIAIVILFYLILPFFQTILTERYNARMKQMENIENEARYQEFIYILKEFRNADLNQKLFGKELFNTGPSFGKKYFHTNRMIHSDMVGFFYGAGLIGILLYLAIYYLIFRDGLKYRRLLKRDPLDRELFAIYFAILFATFLISASGSGTIGERCLVFLYLGAVSGVAKEKLRLISNTAKNINGSIPSGISKSG
jgi:hypothetical protein